MRVDLRGWNRHPPALPDPPIKIEDGGRGTLTCYYDVCPPGDDLTSSDLGTRIYSRLERMLLSEKSPLNDTGESPFARRFTLEVGMMYNGADQRFAASWPAEFLRVLGDADAELVVTHYAFSGADEPMSEDDL